MSEAAPRRDGAVSLRLTSMLDVCFLLLIFFIVTSSFAVSEGLLPMDLPRMSSPGPSRPAPPSSPIRIELTSLGGRDVLVQINGVQTVGDFQELFEALDADRFRPERGSGIYRHDDPVIISPARTVQWDHVVNASNAAVRAGYINIQFTAPR